MGHSGCDSNIRKERIKRRLKLLEEEHQRRMAMYDEVSRQSRLEYQRKLEEIDQAAKYAARRIKLQYDAESYTNKIRCNGREDVSEKKPVQHNSLSEGTLSNHQLPPTDYQFPTTISHLTDKVIGGEKVIPHQKSVLKMCLEPSLPLVVRVETMNPHTSVNSDTMSLVSHRNQPDQLPFNLYGKVESIAGIDCTSLDTEHKEQFRSMEPLNMSTVVMLNTSSEKLNSIEPAECVAKKVNSGNTCLFLECRDWSEIMKNCIEMFTSVDIVALSTNTILVTQLKFHVFIVSVNSVSHTCLSNSVIDGKLDCKRCVLLSDKDYQQTDNMGFDPGGFHGKDKKRSTVGKNNHHLYTRHTFPGFPNSSN